jgi:3-oxoacyl-[acyl-carrier protein] reductase
MAPTEDKSEATTSTGRVALITGGAKGIGRHIALRLGRAGWSVAICYRKSATQAAEVRAAIESSGGYCLALEADVSDPDVCAQLVSEIERWRGRVDALIHAAGPYRRAELLTETPAGWREMFANNLDSLFYLARLVAPPMIAQRYGRMIAFAMANADRITAQPTLTAHYLAKVGVVGLIRSLAKTLAPYGITANAIAPGFIDSEFLPPGEMKGLASKIPAGRVGTVSDATNAVLYLLSDEAAYVSGACLPVSGAWGV